MNFELTPTKFFVFLIVVVLQFNFLLTTQMNFCATALVVCGECVTGFSLLPGCCGCGSSAGELLEQFARIIFPGVLVYVIWSIVEKKK